MAGPALVLMLFLRFLLSGVSGETHSLSYLYTVQSKSSPYRGYGFSVVTLLDDEQIDSYNSISTDTDGTRTPKQDWVRKMNGSKWKDGTDKLKSDGEWLRQVFEKQLTAFKHRESGGHTLQWRISCGDGKCSDGSVVNAINEYGYDGEDFISYNWTLKKWTASVSQDKKMEEEWNAGPNAYQERDKCENWLKIYLQYKPPDIKLSQLNVYMFAKKPKTNSNKLNLTCLVTGFYPKDVVVHLRKFTTSLPEHLLTSSGVRPNEDGTYQLRKSVEIQEGKKTEYDCSVTYSSLKKTVIKQWGGECSNCQSGGVTVGLTVGVTVGLILGVVVLLGVVIYVCKRKRTSGDVRDTQSRQLDSCDEAIPLTGTSHPQAGDGLDGPGSDSAENGTTQNLQDQSSEQQKTANGQHSQAEGQAPQTSSTDDV